MPPCLCAVIPWLLDTKAMRHHSQHLPQPERSNQFANPRESPRADLTRRLRLAGIRAHVTKRGRDYMPADARSSFSWSCWTSFGFSACLMALIVGLATHAVLAESQTGETPALDRAFQALAKLETGQDLHIFNPIRQAVLRAEVDEKVRTDIEARLIEMLQGTATDLAKEYACRQLVNVGSDASVPVLAELLPSPRLSFMGRYAIEGIGGPAAIRSLREALATTAGRPRVGLVISLGRLGDADSVTPIAALLDEEDEQLREAAVVALGRIGTVPAADALKEFAGKASPALRETLIDAELSAAELLCRQGEYGAAARICEALQSAESPRVRAAALRGLIAARPAESVAMVVAGLAAEESWKRDVAADCVVALNRPEAIRTVASAIRELPLPGKIAAFASLRGRRDPAVRVAAFSALDQSDSAVQVVALETLIAAATAHDVPMLIDLAATEEDRKVRDAALKTLRLMTASGTNEAILSILDNGKDLNSLVVRCALARRSSEFVPAFLKAAESSSGAVRLEAFKALEVMATQEDAELLVRLLCKTAPGPERNAAGRAVWMTCRRISDPAFRRAPLLAALDKADSAARCALLPTLGRLGGEEALAAVQSAMQSPDQAVREAGYRALANWPDASVADELLNIAKTSTVPSHRISSLRAFIRVVSLPNQRPPQRTFEMLSSAMTLATRTEDKALLVTRLGAVRVPDALASLLPLVDDPRLGQAAVPAVFTLAKGLSQSHPDQAKAALERIRSLTSSAAILQQIPKVLRDIDARKQGQEQ
jgi:HEAT repeat protein